MDTYKYAANEVLRFGIDAFKFTVADLVSSLAISSERTQTQSSLGGGRSSASGTNYKAIAESVVHQPLEKLVFSEAIAYLLNNKDVRTVLVDVFARDQRDTIQMEGDHPKTHTVVLYKNPANEEQKHEVLVIDPSNFIFSNHLSNTDIVPPHRLLAKITVLHKKDIQIYKPETEPGPNSNQYRDCVDLAVKIAFGLKQMQDWTELDLNHVKNWEVIKER